MEAENLVIYLRRSRKQIDEARGSLFGQTVMAYDYIQRAYANAKVKAFYTELEGGTASRRSKRTEILKAIDHVKHLPSGRLIIAKVDRLSRDIEFTSSLFNAKIPFTCCDMPEANEFTIKLFTLMAEKEARDISDRTKSGLKIKAQVGIKLGCAGHKVPGCKLTRESREKAVSALKTLRSTNRNNTAGIAFAKSLKKEGRTLTDIASVMNMAGFRSPSGQKIKPQTVSRWLDQKE